MLQKNYHYIPNRCTPVVGHNYTVSRLPCTGAKAPLRVWLLILFYFVREVRVLACWRPELRAHSCGLPAGSHSCVQAPVIESAQLRAGTRVAQLRAGAQSEAVQLHAGARSDGAQMRTGTKFARLRAGAVN